MERRKGGRPRKSPEDVRDDYARIRMTDRERAAVEARAAAHGLSISEYFRRRALSQRMPEAAANRQAMAEQTTALLRLGNNLNQIAKNMNAGWSAPPYLNLLLEDIARHVARLSDEPHRDREGPGL